MIIVLTLVISDAGTNSKVGRGGTDPAQSAGKFLFMSCPPPFGSKSTINRFSERFRDGRYSLVSFLFAVLLLTVPRAQPFVKVGGPRAPWSRRHC